MRQRVKTLSSIALFFGILASLSCISASLLLYGMMCSIIGMLISVIVIFLRTKHFDGTKWSHPAIIAMFLNSIPIIYLAVIILIFKDRA